MKIKLLYHFIRDFVSVFEINILHLSSEYRLNIMELSEKSTGFLHTYVSVDCVVFGFDGEELNVLLVERDVKGSPTPGLKLPGSLIYHEEDTDSAAERVLNELTGIRKMKLRQFRCFSSIERTSNPADVQWLETTYLHQIERLITVAHLALTKINRRLNAVSKYRRVAWTPVGKLPRMPFDHNRIVEESLIEIRNWIVFDPSIVFELLPPKFTAAELRKLYEAIYRKPFDVRNFHKKMTALEYIVPLDERQKNVSHRAARYYRFDRMIYNKCKITL